ncbi:IucA/IucC family protein [Paenibacillus sp. JCM 10914]|uniref:IucA/IucC family protein n=1 Tax=Paenibacillus sp. JCM 10914 TaxID=1236974 RepID=UPI0003CCBB77|nr:IucA/IucC family protein [Paenibacillus sp. JCM 10914]GAE06470.1 hypothetical protein JCM10914_2633 [Paenibacillus sp. JCM 10914]
MQNDRTRQEAERRVMEDLLNALLAEDLLIGLQTLTMEELDAVAKTDQIIAGARSLLEDVCSDRAADKLSGLWRASCGTAVMLRLRRSKVQQLRCESLAIVAANDAHNEARLCSPTELMQLVASNLIEMGEARKEGSETFIDMLGQTIEQMAWSLEQSLPEEKLLGIPQAFSLLELERLGALRDRPFHPVAKVKLGWTRDDCSLYAADAARPLQLRWMAVRRDRLLTGDDTGEAMPKSLLLSADEQNELDRELQRLGLKEDYLAVPVHPWQMESILPQRLNPELASGVCVPMNTAVGTYYPTSSVRSLMSLDKPQMHVKLPLGIRSLGGLRYLSAIKLMNGNLAESLLRQAKQLDPVLSDKLHLCEEGRWWALAPHDNDLFADDPRQMSAMVRMYPQELVGDTDYRLMPMSALATHGENPLFGEWLEQRGILNEEQGAMELFREIVGMFGELSLRLLRFGLVPEAHGQNTLLVLKDGCVVGLLLRDHDALRVHVPWLSEAGLEDPNYLLRPGVPNSLYHDTPQQLIAFFQMLGIQINLFASWTVCRTLTGLAKNGCGWN